VALWDLRKLGTHKPKSSSLSMTPIAIYNCGRSVNSAFFAASGRYVVSTTWANKLDVFENFHLSAIASSASQSPSKSPTIAIQPLQSIHHQNNHGSTALQAIGHAKLDVFSVGSMRDQRCVEIFDASQAVVAGGDAIQSLSGDAVTKMFTRLAFHPREDRLLLAGGSGYGRVVVFM
jgi:hypothetical protein